MYTYILFLFKKYYKHKVATLYIYDFSSVIDFYIVSPGHRYSWYQQRRYSEDADEDLNSQPLGHKASAVAIELNSSKASAAKKLSLLLG